MEPLRRTSPGASRWLESGLLDLEFYAALRGREFRDEAEAAEDFVELGMRERLTTHPFLDFVSLPAPTRRAWRNGRVAQVLADLAGSPTSGLSVPEHAGAARADLLELASRLGEEARGAVQSDAPLVDWSEAATRPRHDGRTSVVVVAGDARPTIRAVTSVLESAGGLDVEVVIVDRGSPAHVALALRAALREHASVRSMRVPATVSLVDAANLGVARATGDVVVLLDPRVVVRRGALGALRAPLEDPPVAGVQPVVLGADDRIGSAGLVVPAEGQPPAPLLGGHPADDARRLAGQRLAAISAEAMALRAEDVIRAGGLRADQDPAAAALDLCARLLRRRTGGFRLAPSARVTLTGPQELIEPRRLPPHPLLPADPGVLDRVGFLTGDGRPGPPGPLVVTGRRRERAGQLRWSLKLPSWPGRQGDVWGDTHFADALADALRDLGDDVVTSRRGAHATGPLHLDDVSLALRGLYPIAPVAGQVNVLWVISHPDEVEPSELDGYDVVVAASVPWSARLAERSGREVVPLMQATSFEPPEEGGRRAEAPTGVLFVGNAGGGRDRPLVWKAVEAGVPLTVYGRGWEDLPAGAWHGEYVDNRRLPELYHRHGIVLADHWPDMARNGFIANRVFDAVAAGARVICDDVVGVHDVFDPRDVVVARTAEELAAAVAELERSPRGDDVPRPPLSFSDRARTLRGLVSGR